MLDALRKRSGGLVAKILFAVLVVSFAIWGVNDMFRGGSNTTVAWVGKAEISSVEFQRLYQSWAGAYQVTTPAEAESLANYLLQQLVLAAALDDQAIQLKLGVSREGLAQAIYADPAFQMGTGVFNETVYRDLVARNWGNEALYLAEERRPAELREQVRRAVAEVGADLPETYQRLLHEYDNERRSVLYATISAATLGPPPEPTEEEVATYYAQNAGNWAAPETRTVNLFELTPATLADPAAITPEEVAAEYARQLPTLGGPESRHIWWQQNLTAEQAAAIEARLAAGATFNDLLAAGEIAPLDAGTVERGYFTERAIAQTVIDAAFTLPAGGTAIAAGRFGPTLVHVAEIVPSTAPPLAEVEADIRQDLAEAKVAPLIADLWEEIEDARAGGATLPAAIGIVNEAHRIARDAAIAAGTPADQVPIPLELAIETVVVDAAGNDAAGNPILDLPGRTQLVNAVFLSDVGLADPALDLPGANAFVWYEVAAVNAPHQRTIEEVRDQVVAAWRQQETETRLDAAATAMVERVRAGESFFAVAAEQQLTLATLTDLTRTSTATDPFSDAALAEAFQGALGYVASAPGPLGEGRIVLQVVDVTVPEFTADAIDAEAADALRQGISSDALLFYIYGLQMALGEDVRVNIPLVRQIAGLAN